MYVHYDREKENLVNRRSDFSTTICAEKRIEKE